MRDTKTYRAEGWNDRESYENFRIQVNFVADSVERMESGSPENLWVVRGRLFSAHLSMEDLEERYAHVINPDERKVAVSTRADLDLRLEKIAADRGLSYKLRIDNSQEGSD